MPGTLVIRQEVNLCVHSEADPQSEFEQAAARVVGMRNKVSAKEGELRTYADAAQRIPKRGVEHHLTIVIGHIPSRVGMS